jgi:hypothetical protein
VIVRLDPRFDERDAVDRARGLQQRIETADRYRSAHVLTGARAFALRGDARRGHEFLQRGGDVRRGDAVECVHADLVTVVCLMCGGCDALAEPQPRIEFHAGLQRAGPAHRGITAQLVEAETAELHVISVVRDVTQKLHAAFRERLAFGHASGLKLHDRIRRARGRRGAGAAQIEFLGERIEDSRAQDDLVRVHARSIDRIHGRSGGGNAGGGRSGRRVNNTERKCQGCGERSARRQDVHDVLPQVGRDEQNGPSMRSHNRLGN